MVDGVVGVTGAVVVTGVGTVGVTGAVVVTGTGAAVATGDVGVVTAAAGAAKVVEAKASKKARSTAMHRLSDFMSLLAKCSDFWVSEPARRRSMCHCVISEDLAPSRVRGRGRKICTSAEYNPSTAKT